MSWTVVCQAPPSIRFSRQEYWNELPFPLPEDLPDPGIKPASPAWQADFLPLSYQGRLTVFSILEKEKVSRPVLSDALQPDGL